MLPYLYYIKMKISFKKNFLWSGFYCNQSRRGNIMMPLHFLFIFAFLCTRSFLRNHLRECTCIWNLKTMPVNNEDTHLWTQNLGEKLVIFESLFQAFSVFNVLETCRVPVYTYWRLISELSSLLKNSWNGFLNNAKFVGMDQITCKNCNKSSWMQVNKILLTCDCPRQFPTFFVRSFQWNQIKPLWDEAMFPKLIIFAKY